ncbi:MAG: S8 family serine peptidase [Halomonadaceae bacterium]|uniref:S8 family serine peptidase n=1 Tax=Halomonas TaxID=2745 RepID=UPI001CE48212|nr:S8 family serine peptidase [Halomonas colorata]
MGNRNPLVLAIGMALGTISLTGCSSGGGSSDSGVDPTQGVHNATPSLAPSNLSSGTISFNEESSTSPAEIRLAVVDSAFDINSIPNNHLVIDTLNIHTNTRDVSGGNEWHGNAVASTITSGALGSARLDLIKIEQDGVNRSSAINYAIGEAALRGARVINASFSQRLQASDPRLSFNGVTTQQSFAQVVNANEGKGAVYVISAGNEGLAINTAGRPLYDSQPALYDMTLIAVGTTKDGNIHPSSSFPGDDQRLQDRAIATDYEYRQIGAQGTSFSAARISEYAAGILARWPHMNAQQASQRLLETASKESMLFGKSDCGSNATTNCGTYYLGQGIANIDAALAPEGKLVVAQSEQVASGGELAERSDILLSSAFGNSFIEAGALDNVTAFDSLGRDYQIDLGARAQPRTRRATQLRGQMEQLSTYSAASLQTESVSMGPYRFTSSVNGAGDLLSSRFDGAIGNAYLSAFNFSGAQASPMSAYAESGIMPMISFQGGSALTQSLESVNGVKAHYGLGDSVSLIATHWTGNELDAGIDSDYRANRSDVGFEWQLSPALSMTTQVGRLEESNGLLGASGSGALGLGDHNEMTFAGVAVQAALGNGFSTFAEFEQGRGNAQGSGLLTHIRDVHTQKAALGLQWQNENERAAFSLHQPLRIESGIATLDVPVGRTLDGSVIREDREASLSPSGRQVDIEFGYSFSPQPNKQWQFNLLHTLEPDHIAGAPSDTAAMISYSALL